MKYFLRSVKYFIYLTVFLAIFIIIMYNLGQKAPGTTIWDLFGNGAWWKMLLFLLAFSAIYPMLGFYDRKLYYDNDFSSKKDEIKDLLKSIGYVLSEEDGQTMRFIHKSNLIRFMRMYEDDITIDFSENPALIKGLRKDTMRIATRIEHIFQKESENNK
ncbi:MAG: hypothetical protein LKI53_02850 [Bacteroidales bacterium]|jgi:hypothetical protein|nr:hypothetical protein [Bacteroidales bacterium]